MSQNVMDWKSAIFTEGMRKKQYYETKKELDNLKKKIGDAEGMLAEDQYVYKFFHSRRVGLFLFLIMLVIVIIAGVSFFSAGMGNGYSRYSYSSMTSSFAVAVLTPIITLIIWVIYRVNGKKTALREYTETYIPEQKNAREKIEIWKDEIGEKEIVLKGIQDEFVLPIFLHPYLRRLYYYLDDGRADSLQEAIEILVGDFTSETERDTFKSNLRELEKELEHQIKEKKNDFDSSEIVINDVGGEV